jgi:hypothetical protein
MHEDNSIQFWENEIRFSRQMAMKSVAKSSGVEQLSEKYLWLRILPADAGHHPASNSSRDNVSQKLGAFVVLGFRVEELLRGGALLLPLQIRRPEQQRHSRTVGKAEYQNSQLEAWSRRFTAIVLSLMPWETIEDSVDVNPEGLPEGACARVEVNRYERSRVNRANCIEILGDSCKACGFNFGRAYGPIGLGFIHVHHIVPVSELGSKYIVDPGKDLVPLCPNCHAMAHQRKPPLGIDELKHLLATGNLTASEPARGQASD